MNIIRRYRKRISVPMNAMCDIAFLLFIFIMVISAINNEKPENFEYAVSAEGEEQVPALEFFVSPDGTVFNGGIIDDAAVTALAAEAVRENSEALIAVSAHRECEYRHVDRLVSLLKKGGCINFLFSAEKFSNSY